MRCAPYLNLKHLPRIPAKSILLMNIEIDSNLWIELDHCEGEHYLIGNCHTFPGRMNAYCTKKETTFCVSLSEISNMSEQSRYWIKGFLTGNEPEPPEELENETPEQYFNSERYRNWLTQTEAFRKNGGL